jgi:hypothetical protein
MRNYQPRVIATLRVRHAASNRFVMFGADGVGFRSAFEPVRALLVRFFKPAAAARAREKIIEEFSLKPLPEHEQDYDAISALCQIATWQARP